MTDNTGEVINSTVTLSDYYLFPLNAKRTAERKVTEKLASIVQVQVIVCRFPSERGRMTIF